MTDPAIVDIPTVINIKSSCLVIEDKYGLTSRGASTWPKNTLAVAPNPIGPPTLSGFLNNTDNALTIIGIILQCHSRAEIADIKIIKVRPPKANIKVPPGFVISKGAFGAPSAK